jgi:hypothetical protein
MSRVRFEPKTPVFESAKTVHALDCAATVFGLIMNRVQEMRQKQGRHQQRRIFQMKTL